MAFYRHQVWQGLDVSKFLLCGFIFLGPLGNLLTPAFFPTAFRFYYFLLPACFLFFRRLELRIGRSIAIFIPFFLYCFFSALYVEFYELPQEPYPLARFFLFLFHFLFVMGAVSSIILDKKELLTLYMKAFFMSLCVGYVLYSGYEMGFFSFSLIQKSAVLGQVGYGYLRFSPGSYPNEYGIMSSFVLSLLTLALLGQEKEVVNLSRKAVLFFFPLTLGALILTTTRAAYLAYLGSLLYIVFKTRRYKLILKLFFLCAGLLFILEAMGIDLFSVFKLFFTLKQIEGGSLGERFEEWRGAFSLFLETPWTGVGFARVTNVHNVYLQLFCEIGIFGMVLLLPALGYLLWERRRISAGDTTLFSLISWVGFFHVFWFACSNHNLNHHLTWLVFVLF